MDGFDEMTIKIEDDFDPGKIASCGQCFRAKGFADGTYRFITGNQVIYIRKLGGNDYTVCCGKNSWGQIWEDYFDLGRNYRKIRENINGKNAFVDRAVAAGAGLRVLRQDAWEMLITFIISQRKNIPAIARAVENLSVKYGEEVVTPFESIHEFPSPRQLRRAAQEELASCGLGYRTAYVRDAAERVSSGALDLRSIASLGDEELFSELLKVHGVGKKVANCVCLFGYGRISRVPVDVWISRAIREEWQGQDPFADFGAVAGIVQQYIFYYERGRQMAGRPQTRSKGIEAAGK